MCVWCMDSGAGSIFQNEETAEARLEGFTIKNCWFRRPTGAGIVCGNILLGRGGSPAIGTTNIETNARRR